MTKDMPEGEAPNGEAPKTGSAPRGRRPAIFGAAAFALVAIVGAAILYANRTGAGNEAAADGCPANAAIVQAVRANARGMVAAVSPVAEPFDASGFAFDDASGHGTQLSKLAGKTLLVNLWATWCVPCRREMPALDALARKEAGGGFAVVPINVDAGGADKPKAFYKDTGLATLPFYHDGSMGVFRAVKDKGLAYGLPVSLLVDRQGCVRAAVSGPAEWASPDAVRLIEAVKAANARAG